MEGAVELGVLSTLEWNLSNANAFGGTPRGGSLHISGGPFGIRLKPGAAYSYFPPPGRVVGEMSLVGRPFIFRYFQSESKLK